MRLYAIVPYAFEYVRVATQAGTPGLAKRFSKQVVVLGNVRAILEGLKAVIKMDPAGLMDTYLTYEISRIKSSAGKQSNLTSVLLHEVITDMGLALDLPLVFRSHIAYLSKIGVKPGFHTRNFPSLIGKFNEWDIDLNQVIITTPSNKIDFQMNPSR